VKELDFHQAQDHLGCQASLAKAVRITSFFPKPGSGLHSLFLL